MSHASQQAGDRGAGGARAVDDHFHVREFAACHFGGINEGGQDDDGCSMLIVVKDGDPEVPQAAFDLEATGGGNILEIDAAEDRRDGADGADDLVDVLSFETRGYPLAWTSHKM